MNALLSAVANKVQCIYDGWFGNVKGIWNEQYIIRPDRVT